MPLSERALANDIATGIPLIPVKDIYSDSEFNCRGFFTATDVMELVRDTAERGLLEPIVIRPLWANELEPAAKGFKYSLVAGFRRYTAYKVNNAEAIPAIVRHDIKTEFDARDINAIENLQRKDLTFWQEARSIQHYWVASWGRDQIAQRVSKSSGWVQLRVMLLECEKEIQMAADQGYILPADIRDIHRLKGDERLRVAGRIRDARKSSSTGGTSKLIAARIAAKKLDKPETKKVRKPPEVQELMESLRKYNRLIDRTKDYPGSYFITEGGNSIAHRIVAWSAGEISTWELHRSLQTYYTQFGVIYVIPEMSGRLPDESEINAKVQAQTAVR